MAPHRRREKGRIAALVKAARAGDIQARGAALTAYRVRLARLSAGRDDEQTEEAEAGELLDASAAQDLTDLREMVLAYLKASSEAASG